MAHFTREHPRPVHRQHAFLAVRHAHQFDASFQYDENAVLGIALIENDFPGGHLALFTERHQTGNLRLVQFREHPFREFDDFCH